MVKKSTEKKEKEEWVLPEVFFEWEIPEYTKHKRSSSWYLIMFIIALALIIYSIFTANFLFALIIILGVFIVFLRDVKAEIKKVTWPSKNEVYSTTIVVIIATIFFGVYLYVLDIFFSWLISQVKAIF